MKRLLNIFALFFVGIVSVSAQTLTLEQCIDTALTKNRLIKQQSLERQSSEIAYEQARKNLLPTLSAGASQSFYFGLAPSSNNVLQSTNNSSKSSFNVSAGITLFDGLRMFREIDAKKAILYASESDLERMKNDIRISVSTAFLQVVLNKELLQIAEEQLKLTEENLIQKRKLVANGRLAEGELYELEAQQAKEELSKVQADNNFKLSMLDLAQILEIENFQALDVTVPEDLFVKYELQNSPEEVYLQALTHRSEIKGAEYRLQSSLKNVSIARSYYYPSLSFGAGISTGYYNLQSNSFSSQLSDNMSTSLELTLNIPIFSKFQVKSNVQTAQLSVESSKIEIESAKIELRKNIQQAYQNAIAAKTKWDVAEKSEKAAREAFRFANQKFESGRINQYELFQAKNNLTQVLSEKAQAKYEYIFRSLLLELYK